jgi:hypothetical protein
MKLVIRILLFSSKAFKMSTKKKLFSKFFRLLPTYCRYIHISLHVEIKVPFFPCCGADPDPGYGAFLTIDLDPDSIRSTDPDPISECGFGPRRAVMTHKNRKKLRNFMF